MSMIENKGGTGVDKGVLRRWATTKDAAAEAGHRKGVGASGDRRQSALRVHRPSRRSPVRVLTHDPHSRPTRCPAVTVRLILLAPDCSPYVLFLPLCHVSAITRISLPVINALFSLSTLLTHSPASSGRATRSPLPSIDTSSSCPTRHPLTVHRMMLQRVSCVSAFSAWHQPSISSHYR